MSTFLFLFLLISPVYSSCPIGQKFVSSGIGCVPCEAGTYQDQATQSFTCKNCLAGTYESNTGQASCLNCAVGRYQPNTRQTSCLDCAAGRYQSNTGQTSCLDCSAGRYQDQSGQQNCDPCPLGMFQNDEGKTSCIVCPVGKYQDKMGYTFCESCGVGQMQDQTGQKECKCDVGYFDNGTDCTACPAGKYQNELDQTECMECERGYYQNATAQQSCIQCDGRLGTAHSGSTSHEECSICLPGSYTYYLNGELKECRDCEVGTFQAYQTQESCNKCQPGTYANEAGLTGCLPCLVGQYQDQYGQKDCKDCGKGKYQYKEGSDSCLYCPNGRSHILTAQTSPEACIAFYQKVRDVPQPVVYTKECEIRDGFTIQCPVCSCFDDSRRGHFDGPICQQCVRGFSTASCKPKCPGYDTINDQTLCSNLGACYFGKQGDSVCYCGADGSIDDANNNIVVDVRDNDLERYFKVYSLDFSVIRIEMGMQWKPTRPMKFELFSESTIRQNQCSKCLKEPSDHAPNGYTASNCQYECSNCLFSGSCDNTPRLGQTNTICSCRSIAYGTEDLCCPKGFRPYVSGTLSLPYIKKITPSETPYLLDNVFYGNEKDLCRPCPGLFGLGVEESETVLATPTDATNFWWTKPLAAFTKSCNAMGTCDFYHDKTSYSYTINNSNTEICLTFRPPNKQPTGGTCTSHQDCVSGYCDIQNRWGCFQRCLAGVEQLIESTEVSFDINSYIVHIPNSYFNAFNDSYMVEKKTSGQICTQHSECYSGVCGYIGACQQKCLTRNIYHKNTTKIILDASEHVNGVDDAERFIACWKRAVESKRVGFYIQSDACQMASYSNDGSTHDVFEIQHVCEINTDQVTKPTYRPVHLSELKKTINRYNLIVVIRYAIDIAYQMHYSHIFLIQDYVVLYNYNVNHTLNTNYDAYNVISGLNMLTDNCKPEEDIPVFTYEDGLDPMLGGVCPKGYYCYEGLKNPCPKGYYSNLEGRLKSYVETNRTGEDNFICIKCPLGSSTMGLDGQSNCQNCPMGRYVFNEGEDCALCPVNTYQPVTPLSENGVDVCIYCNNQTSLPGSVSESQCSTCPAGTGVFDDHINCTACKKGFFSEHGICEKCPTGKSQDKTGKTQCDKCAKGRYQSVIGALACTECPIGQYQDTEGLPSCKYCGLGKYQNNKGQDTCRPCNTGKYMNSRGASSCKICPTSQWQDSSGQTQCKPKKTCARGSWGKNGCSKNGYFVKHNGSPNKDRTCEKCPWGRFAESPNHNQCLVMFTVANVNHECTSTDKNLADGTTQNHRNCFTKCVNYDYRTGINLHWGNEVCLVQAYNGQTTCYIELTRYESCSWVWNPNVYAARMYACNANSFEAGWMSRSVPNYWNCDHIENCQNVRL